MKIVYIGAGGALAEALAERMGQEGNDVYLLSDKAPAKKTKGVSLHRFYRSPRKGENFGKLLRSIAPDCVIFAGNDYISGVQGEGSDEDVTLLARSLRAVSAFPQVRFILLSSTEVYGAAGERVDESAVCAAVSERGIRFIQEEQLVELYQKQHGMDCVVLRASQIYSDRPREDQGDFLSRTFSAVVQAKGRMPANMFQPLHVSDLVDAVKRVADAGMQRIYNVCGDIEISAQRLYQLVCWQQGVQEQAVRWEGPDFATLADSSLIREELGWSNFRNLEEQLKKGEITYKRVKTKDRNKKVTIPADIRQTVENLVLFEAFFLLSSFCGSHSLFSQIDWLMVYVILIAISYNIYQSALAAILASAAYLYSQDLSILEMTAFHSYADAVQIFMQYVSLGLIVSYTTNTLKQEVWSVRLDLDMLKEEYEDLKAVNDENVLIKNEYEERLLTSKTGFPKLYDLTSRLMVLEPERILMETMQVISELVRTDTVAVYQGQAGSPWLRLVGALSDSSVMEGKSWNLSNFPKIYTAVAQGRLYQGKLGSGEPAIVLPIVCRDSPAAVVLIKTLPYECETLYHVNLLKTMSLLLRDSMEKALQYEELSRPERFVEDTDIMKPETFRKRVRLAEEKAEKSMAEYCVVELAYSGSLKEAAAAVSRVLRVADCLGTDGEGKLFVLLNNTGAESLEYLRERLRSCGVELRSEPGRPEEQGKPGAVLSAAATA